MNDFLKAQQFLYQRVLDGKEIYPAEGVLKQFQLEAKKIDAERHFTIYGCQDCVQSLIKFVYEATINNTTTSKSVKSK